MRLHCTYYLVSKNTSGDDLYVVQICRLCDFAEVIVWAGNINEQRERSYPRMPVFSYFRSFKRQKKLDTRFLGTQFDYIFHFPPDQHSPSERRSSPSSTSAPPAPPPTYSKEEQESLPAIQIWKKVTRRSNSPTFYEECSRSKTQLV